MFVSTRPRSRKTVVFRVNTAFFLSYFTGIFIEGQADVIRSKNCNDVGPSAAEKESFSNTRVVPELGPRLSLPGDGKFFMLEYNFNIHHVSKVAFSHP